MRELKKVKKRESGDEVPAYISCRPLLDMLLRFSEAQTVSLVMIHIKKLISYYSYNIELTSELSQTFQLKRMNAKVIVIVIYNVYYL